MGAYKESKKKSEEIAGRNMGINYAVLEAGLNVVKSAKKKDGSIDFEKVAEKPEDYICSFTQSMNGYVQSRLQIPDKEWKKQSEEHNSRLLKSFGITPKLIRYVISGVVAQNKLLNLGEVLQTDRNFEGYQESQMAEFDPAQQILERGYRDDRLGTVNEMLDEFKLTGLVDPRAVSLQDLPLLERLSKQPADRLEEIISKTEPRLLRSSYKP